MSHLEYTKYLPEVNNQPASALSLAFGSNLYVSKIFEKKVRKIQK